MAELISHALTEPLLRKLQGEQFVLLATIDEETGVPAVNAVSWVYAPDTERIRIAVGHKSRMIGNVTVHPGACVTMIGPDTTYEITGKATVTQAPLEGVQIKLACLELKVETVKSVMFYGAKIVQEVKVEKTYDKEAADKLDRQVLEALKRS
ncbi:pyridoxamine 5'-phosphate oxidase family protein [Salinithrix halophila]|uniref:Pyridoxamine 5'-phosphate oxidase family protein n=1 Tax=Salinithrix halophila TaxID=1485204 RepID=A0ABV8JDU5_9BACL